MTEKKTQAAKFASLSNHRFPRRALFALTKSKAGDVFV